MTPTSEWDALATNCSWLALLNKFSLIDFLSTKFDNEVFTSKALVVSTYLQPQLTMPQGWMHQALHSDIEFCIPTAVGSCQELQCMMAQIANNNCSGSKYRLHYWNTFFSSVLLTSRCPCSCLLFPYRWLDLFQLVEMSLVNPIYNLYVPCLVSTHLEVS